jgi:N-acyl-D-amino-acid deacylase
VAIRGGTVIDGSGGPSAAADVTVVNGVLASIDPRPWRPDADTEVIDAGGLVVCPGFIDMHAHSDLAVFGSERHLAKSMQGITTEALGQDGLSYAPVRDAEVMDAMRRQISGWNGEPDLTYSWRTVADYFAAITGRIAVNVAYLVPHGTLRVNVAGYEGRPLSGPELGDMCAMARQAMRDGAVGVSLGLTYPPAAHAPTSELVALARAVAELGGYLCPHHRSYGRDALASYAECVDIARATGIRLHLPHANMNYPMNKGKASLLLDLVEDARAEGLAVTMDSYPYAAGSTYLAGLLPSWATDGGGGALDHLLSDGDALERVRFEMEVSGSDGAHGSPIDWSHLVISGGRHQQVRDLVGCSIADAAARLGETPFAVYCQVLRLDGANASCVNFAGHEENIRVVMASPHQAIGTDAILVGDRPHPRGWGAFPRFLGRYVREEKLVPLEEAIRKITSLPASIIGARGRGLLRPGYAADLVCFDSETIIDRATYDNPRQYPLGIVHVMVNGVWVIRDGQATGAQPGQVLRGPRFQAA